MRKRFGFGGTVESNSVGQGFWTRKTFDRRSDDIYITLTDLTARHPNLITKKLYGKDNLVWLLLQYNNIIDPVDELISGKQVVLPHPTRVL